MKFVFFTKGDKTVPSSRYRAYYVAEALIELGHEVTVIPTANYSLTASLHYLRTLLSLPAESVVYLQRPVLNRHFVLAAAAARLLGRHFIFDFDDAVYEHSLWQTRLLVSLADFVTCGSKRVQNWALKYNKKSFVLLNSIPLFVYAPRPIAKQEPPVIGWIGSLPHVFLKSAVPALKELARQKREFGVRIIGAMGNREVVELLDGVPNVTVVDSLNWADPTEAVKEISQFSIGIMPLSDSPWDQVKYFKALEYMACGVPVVASSGETVQEIIERSKAGLVASSTEEWVEHLSKLLDSPSLRDEMGRRGRATILAEYSLEVTTRRFLTLVDENLTQD